MKTKRNDGFTLIETLIAIVILGIVVVPTCSSLIMAFRMNAKADQMLRDQLAVSSAVETLMAEGIIAEGLHREQHSEGAACTCEYWGSAEGDRFPDVKITAVKNEDGDYYDVTVRASEDVSVTTHIRAKESQGGGGE